MAGELPHLQLPSHSRSIKFVHQDCLVTWLRVSGSDNRCELCHETIQFRHVYAENAPALLPLSEFMALLVPRVRAVLEYTTKVLVAALLWFVLLPLQTAWCLKTCLLINANGLLAIPATADPSFLQPVLVTWWVGVALNFVVMMVSHLALALFNFLNKELRVIETNVAPNEERNRLENPDLHEDLREAGVEEAEPAEELFRIPRREGVLGVGVVGEIGEEEDALQELFIPSIVKCAEMMVFNAAFLLAVVCLPAMVGQTLLYLLSLMRRGMGRTVWRDFVMNLDMRGSPELGVNLALLLLLDLDEQLLRRTVAMGGEMAVGYCAIFACLVSVGFGYFLVNYNHRTMLRAQQALSNAIVGAVDWNLRLFKYSVIVGVLFCFLPNAIGWLIDLSTLRVFDCSLAERMSMCSDRVLFCTAVHWLLGFLFVLHAAAIVSETRALLNISLVSDFLPDFSNDLADFGQLIELEDNLHAPPLHARNLAHMSVIQLLERTLLYTLYCLLGVMLCVLIPVNFGHFVVPGSHPLKFQYENTIFDVHVSMEMLFFHFVLPFALERLRHRNLTKWILKTFFENACQFLDLNDLLAEEVDRRIPALVQITEMSIHAMEESEQRLYSAEMRRLDQLRVMQNSVSELDALLKRYYDALLGQAPTYWLEALDFFRQHVNDTLILDLSTELIAIRSKRLDRLRSTLNAMKERQDELRRVAGGAIEMQSMNLLQSCISNMQSQLNRVSALVEEADGLDFEFSDQFNISHIKETVTAAAEENSAFDEAEDSVFEDNETIWCDVASENEGEDTEFLGDERDSSPMVSVGGALQCWENDGFPSLRIPALFTQIIESRLKITVRGSSMAELDAIEEKVGFNISNLLSTLSAETLQIDNYPFSLNSSPMALNRWQVPYFVRVLVLCIAAAFVIAFSFSALIHLPLLIGGAFLRLAGLPSGHDLYCIVVGAVFLWASVASCQQLVLVLAQSMRNADFTAVMVTLSKYCLVVLKVAVVGVVWLTAVPFLVGILFEVLFLVPALTQYNETPFYPLMQSWAMGLVFLKMWARGVLIGAVGGDEWRVKLERVLELGFERLDVVFVFGQIISPILLQLLDQLLVPYFLGKLAGLFFPGDYLVQSCIMRFAYIAYLALRLAYRAMVYLIKLVIKMHNEFRDSRYLLGTELANRIELVSR